MFRPIPTPATRTSRIASPAVRAALHRVKRRNARVRQTIPATTRARYPTRNTRRAPMIENATHPRTKGVSTKPARVAELPATVCMNSGTKEIAPNIAMPARKPVMTAATTIRLLNSRSGTIGSAALRSTATKPARASAATTSGATTSRRCHAPVWPAATTPRRSDDTPAANSATPA